MAVLLIATMHKLDAEPDALFAKGRDKRTATQRTNPASMSPHLLRR